MVLVMVQFLADQSLLISRAHQGYGTLEDSSAPSDSSLGNLN